MAMSWRGLLMCAAGILTTLHGVVATDIDCASGTGNLQNNHPLPQESEARYLLSDTTSSNGIQVIVPQMAFGCSGRITAWSAHTLVLTKPNFVELLTHRIAMQVWRPSQEVSGKYSLVGSNDLTFADTELRNGITEKTGTNQSAFFSFTNKTVMEDEQIYFMAGDVIGWYVYPIRGSIDPPLSPLYREPIRSDVIASVVNLLIDRASQGSCVQYNENEQLEEIEDVVPMLSVTYKVGRLATCSDSSSNNRSTTPTTTSATTPSTTIATSDTNQSAALQSTSLSTADIICIVIAALTLVLHVILIIICGLNCFALKEIRAKLHSTAAMPPSMSMMQLAYNNKRTISDETPANYDPARAPQEYERTENTSSPYETVDGNNRANLPTKRTHLQTHKGTDSPALSTRSDYSREGSRLDLLKI